MDDDAEELAMLILLLLTAEGPLGHIRLDAISPAVGYLAAAAIPSL